MREIKWNDGWKFWKDKDSFALVWNVPDLAQEVTLPHDAMIGNAADPDSKNGGNTGFRNGDVYTYVKTLFAPEAYREQTVMLKFEGIYMNSFVYVNGQLAAKRPYGYAAFYVPLNDFLRYGQENEIRVQVRAGAMTNSRWYSGAGIYRDACLLEGGQTYLVPDGVQIKTESADADYAVLGIRAEIKNRESTPQEFYVDTAVKDPDGKTVGRERTAVTLFEGEARTISQRIAVERPGLWSAQTPVLYGYEVTLVPKAETDSKTGGADSCFKESGPAGLDAVSGTFGIRVLSLDAKRGLRVNGETVKLRGACIHHDSGLLGAATYEDAQYRQVRLLKEAGFNAIRMSHHPMAPAMLRACDEIGMYVMDETFDMWNRLKSDYDYGLFFGEWWEQDTEAMVRKDFNHPCVVMYSVGNEIPEIGTEHGSKTCHEICEKIRSLDDTRYLTAAINGVFAAGDAIDRIVADLNTGTGSQAEGNVNEFITAMDQHMDEIVTHPMVSERLEKACEPLDIAGYNYMTARYEPDRETYPNRVIVGSETYPPEIARNWDLVERLPGVIGDFTWTGWDYIGEAGVGICAYRPGEGGFGAGFPAQLAYCGDIDLTGYRRPASYFREAVFGLTKKPYIAVQDPAHYGEPVIKTTWVISDASANWTYKGMEGKPVIAEVYAAGDEAELLLNGVSLGKKPAGKKTGFRTLFELTYEPGVLTAVSYENGAEAGRTELATAGADRQLILTQEPYRGSSNRKQELVYIQVEMRDKNGNPAADDGQKLVLSAEGDAEILGFGSGNPKPKYNFNEGVTNLFKGRALIILKKPEHSVTLTVQAEDGTEGTLVVS